MKQKITRPNKYWFFPICSRLNPVYNLLLNFQQNSAETLAHTHKKIAHEISTCTGMCELFVMLHIIYI